MPKAVVARLSLYLRELEHLVRDGKETTSSSQLGRRLGFTDAQVRKDLAYFGQFGQPGVGYRTGDLVSALKSILGTDQVWPAAMIGVGNLGRALLGYKGFAERGFRIAALFDTDPAKIQTSVDGLVIQSVDNLQKVVRDLKIRLGLIVVPAASAPFVADQLVAVGVEGILNFAPVALNLPKHVNLVSVDLAVEWELLSFAIASRQRAAHGNNGVKGTGSK